MALAQNHARDVWIWPWLQDIVQDVRFAVRLFVKDRRFALAAILALALGIAANTTIFTLVNAALFKELPFDEPRQIMSLATRDAHGETSGVSFQDFQDWRHATHALSGLAASIDAPIIVADTDQAPQRLRGTYISANAFGVLRVTPLLGRSFLPSDEQPGVPPVVILGNDVWQQRYHGDPGVVGRTIRVNKAPTIVIGVMPARFTFPLVTEVWQPLNLVPQLHTEQRDARDLSVFGRLRPSVTVEQARAELGELAAGLARQYPETNRGITATVAAPLEHVRHFVRPMLMTLMSAVAFVLVIACANVANLLLARAASRSREIAVRTALGATRGRIVRQLLIEGLLLATVAGIVGLLLSVYGVRYFGVAFDAMSEAEPDRAATPYWINLTMNGPVFAFVAALCLGSSLAFGLAPALHIAKTDVNDIVKDSGRATLGSRRARRWTGALLIGELSLTMVLLCGAGLLVRSFLMLYRANVVIDTANLLTARLALPADTYDSPQQQRFFDALDRRLVENDGIGAMALASDIPFASLGGSSRQLLIDGQSIGAGTPPLSVSCTVVGPRYFETIGLPVIRGRTLTSHDRAPGAESAVINQRLAEMFFPEGTALGRRIRLAHADQKAIATPWLTVVGIVPALPHFGRELPEPLVFVPAGTGNEPMPYISIIVRASAKAEHSGETLARTTSSGSPGRAAIASRLREAVRALDPNLPLYSMQTVDDVLARARYPHRIIGTLLGLIAFIALVLSAVGLYALTAHGVAQRTLEVGLRMALGAQTSQIAWLFIRQTFVRLAVGLTIGTAGALATGRLLQSFLVQTGPRDPLTMVSVAVILIVVSLTASFLPARRAWRLDPVVALRHE